MHDVRSTLRYLDEHVEEDTESHMHGWFGVGKVRRPLNVEGAARRQGEVNGADNNAHHLGSRWLACGEVSYLSR